LNISSGLVWLVITILGYRAYKKYQRKNDPHSLEDGESEVTNQAIDDLMKHYQNDLDKRK
jgi:hypothetical protein